MPAHNYQIVFRALPVAIQIMDRDLVVVDATDEYLRATMRERDGLVGSHVFAAFPPSTDNQSGYHQLRESFNRVLTKGRAERLPPFVYPVRSVDHKESILHWQVSNTPIFGPDGEVAGIINMVEDMTAVVRRQASRDELAATLAETLAAIAESAAGLRRALESSYEPHAEIIGVPRVAAEKLGLTRSTDTGEQGS